MGRHVGVLLLVFQAVMHNAALCSIIYDELDVRKAVHAVASRDKAEMLTLVSAFDRYLTRSQQQR